MSAILSSGQNDGVTEQTEPPCFQQNHVYSPSLLSVLQLLSAPRLLSGPSVLEAPEGLESPGAPEGPAAPEDLETPAGNKQNR